MSRGGARSRRSQTHKRTVGVETPTAVWHLTYQRGRGEGRNHETAGDSAGVRQAMVSFPVMALLGTPTASPAPVAADRRLVRALLRSQRPPLDLGSHRASLRALLPRKEVIQPQLPLRLPCYDFVPVTSPTLDGSVLAVRAPASSVASFHDVTGGVYKAREHIHRGMADPRLLATPPSWGRVAAPNLN